MFVRHKYCVIAFMTMSLRAVMASNKLMPWSVPHHTNLIEIQAK